ncbi:hypothetical protein AB4Y90_10160 [Chryseobacterium sp. 2TAF14]|uniref:hypothetical protein n=1 Tax=Chryseobacterium sp. 2TAF14 TaxID=3233007 RepID=UPI003F9120FE
MSDGAAYKVFTERKADITKMLPEQQYAAMDKNVKVNTVIAKAYNATTKKLDEAYFLTEAQKFMTKDESENLLKRVKASRALKDKDIATYEKLTLELNKDVSALNADQLNSLAWNFFENVTTKSSLETAVKWAQESVNKKESYANTDTLANLYNKIGDKKNAKIWAQKSVELGKAAGEDIANTEKLLKSL